MGRASWAERPAADSKHCSRRGRRVKRFFSL